MWCGVVCVPLCVACSACTAHRYSDPLTDICDVWRLLHRCCVWMERQYSCWTCALCDTQPPRQRLFQYCAVLLPLPNCVQYVTCLHPPSQPAISPFNPISVLCSSSHISLLSLSANRTSTSDTNSSDVCSSLLRAHRS